MLVGFTLLFLILVALFAGSEIAFISASKLRVELMREKGSRRGAIVAQFFEKPKEFIGAMLIGLNIALVALTYLLTQFWEEPLKHWIHDEFLLLLVLTILIEGFILLLGEFIPKMLFQAFADTILFNLAFPLKVFQVLLSPLSWVMTKIANKLLRFFFQLSEEEEATVFTTVDLENFIKNTRTESEEEIDTQLFENALYFKEVKVKNCMVPRQEIAHIDIDDSVEDLLQLFQETKLSKVLVTQENIHNVLGYVHHQQILKRPKDIKSILMDILIVPESMRVDNLMTMFSKRRSSIACVVDEFGSTTGVITMEDILEQIFGDIEDEHDQEDYTEIEVNDHEFIFSGRLEIDYLNEKYVSKLAFPEGEYSTLSGYIVTTTTTIPEEGSSLELEGYRFIFEAVGDKKIETIRVLNLRNE